MRFFSILALGLFLGGSVIAGEFKIFDTTAKTEESLMPTLTVVTDKQWFVMAALTGFIRRVDEEKRTIVFEAGNGGATMVMSFTTNSPSVLPDEGQLHTNMTKLYPGAEIVRGESVRTRPQFGYLYELKTGAGNLALMTQHVYIPTSEGLVEVKFTANSDDAQKLTRALKDILYSFHAKAKPPSK